MNMVDLLARFPAAERIEINDLIRTEEVGKDPWRLYIYRQDGKHEGGIWFKSNGPIRYPREEISFARARQYVEIAIGRGLEVRVCDGMDHLVFHSEKGKVVFGATFWNEARPDPAAVRVADRL